MDHYPAIRSIEDWANLPIFLIPGSGLEATVAKAAIILADVGAIRSAGIRDYLHLDSGRGVLGMVAVDGANGPTLKRVPREVCEWALECCIEARKHANPLPARVRFRPMADGMEVSVLDGVRTVRMPRASLNVYIDESGNSGDAAKHGNLFVQQPTFALVGVGEVDESHELPRLLEKVRARHGAKAQEIKARSMNRYPELGFELLIEVLDCGAPLFVELMDKAFFVANNIVTYAVIGAIGPFQSYWGRDIANSFADVVTEHVGWEGMAPYCEFALDPSQETFERFREAFRNELIRARRPVGAGRLRELLGELSSAFEHSLAQCESSDNERPGYMRLLPPPDFSARGKRIGMLPYVSGFAHVYARMNRFAADGVRVRAVHDEQLQYEHVLEGYARMLESNDHADELRQVTPGGLAEWEFRPGKMSLEFAKSNASPGVQVADILARLLAQRLNAVVRGEPPQEGCALEKLLACGDAGRGIGVNVVSTYRRYWRFWSAH